MLAPGGTAILGNDGNSAATDGLEARLKAAGVTEQRALWRKRGGSCGDFFVSDGKDFFLTGMRYGIKHCKSMGNASFKGVLQTTKYGNEIAFADYMASVEPALSNQKHNSLTDGWVRGENLAFNDKLGVAAYRYCYHMPPEMKKKEKEGQLYIYAATEGKQSWLLDENISQQMIAVALAGDTAYMAGLPTSQNPKDRCELWALAGVDGKKLQTLLLDSRPVYDGVSRSLAAGFTWPQRTAS